MFSKQKILDALIALDSLRITFLIKVLGNAPWGDVLGLVFTGISTCMELFAWNSVWVKGLITLSEKANREMFLINSKALKKIYFFLTFFFLIAECPYRNNNGYLNWDWYTNW